MGRAPKGFQKDDYCTPADVLALVYAAIGVPDLDPCSSAQSIVVSKRAFRNGEADRDGLLASWILARTVYMNPPYSNTLEWVNAFFRWFVTSARNEGVMLLSAESGLVWWQDLLLPRVDRMIFLPRVAFLANGKPITGARHNSVLIYMGHRRQVIRHVWPAPVFRPCQAV